MIIQKKKTKILKMIRVFDRVEKAIDPWNSTTAAPSLAESMHRTADDNSYLTSPTLPSTVSSSSSSSYPSSTTPSTSVGVGSTSALTSPTPTSSGSQPVTTSTTPTSNNTLPTQSQPVKDVTPYNQFLTKIFYPNPLQRSEASGLYKEARDLMTKFDKAFVLLIFALLVLHFFKRVD